MNSENRQGRSGLGNQRWRKSYNYKQLELNTFCAPLNLYFPLLLLVLPLLLACPSIDGDDADEFLKTDVVAAQFDPSAFNIAALSARPSRRNAVLLGEHLVNRSGGVLGANLNVIALAPRTGSETLAFAEEVLDAGISVLNVSFSSRSQAVAEIATPREAIVITESGTSPSLTNFPDDDFLFRLVPSDIFQGRVLAELALEAGQTSAAIVLDAGDAFGQNLAEQFRLNFESLGGQISRQVEVPSSLNVGFGAFIGEIFSGNPSVVLNSMLNPERAANLINEAASSGMRVKYLFPDTIAGKDEFLQNVADISGVGDALGASAGFGLASSSEFEFFRESYYAQFGLEPEAFNAAAYDYVLIVALAIEHAGRSYSTSHPSGPMIRDSLRSVMNSPGTPVGPGNIARALEIIREGGEVDYNGAYAATDWDENGDVVGIFAYDIFEINVPEETWTSNRQVVIEE